ncbi:putative exported protein [Halobacteriovorax marinus SJ]|uniref:Exported protein n=1 Tax=Halobacteriovorax marinus (strain ATCC BAA-682 / DSM 15412 / SJ) TaxID=862908 RepID=E1WZ42_HALMS|nr:prepilin-type N-terminal cleavage/methylation domain-containing protein [Halobacteriovorax marinus]CBW26139.1 putative exported protein [Halobacteriovorax marinus SJ]
MAEKLKYKLTNDGFTLVEVMISLAIFAVFASAYLTAQGFNISDSTVMREELELKRYAELKVNELIVTPPELKESITLTKETGKFEENDNFTYSIEYKKFLIPDLNKITGADEEAQDPNESKIFENVKKNLEKIIWQVEVTVKNETSERSYSVSTWLYNHQAQVMFEQM